MIWQFFGRHICVASEESERCRERNEQRWSVRGEEGSSSLNIESGSSLQPLLRPAALPCPVQLTVGVTLPPSFFIVAAPNYSCFAKDGSAPPSFNFFIWGGLNSVRRKKQKSFLSFMAAARAWWNFN